MSKKEDNLHSFLSQGFCSDCSNLLFSRIQSLAASSSSGALDGIRIPRVEYESQMSLSSSSSSSCVHPPTPGRKLPGTPTSHGSSTRSSSVRSAASVLMKGLSSSAAASFPGSSSASSNGWGAGEGEVSSADCDDLDEGGQSGHGGHELSSEQREWIRFSEVKRKKDFVLMEKVRGRNMNVLQGLELHAGVFNAKEQERIVNCVYEFQKLGREGRLRERTYSEPNKWMRGKGRVTIQFGCCYNYAADKNGNPPGIIRSEEVDPLPPLFKMMVKRMVRWHVLPSSCVPNSCIVNIYDKGDCIPPHIDHHDFVRPFCTASFLSECNILFGHTLEIVGPGEFSAPTAIPLPVGSVFILNGNGADVAKHCVSACPAKRISITFRKMDDAKIPIAFKHDPELQSIRPLQRSNRPQQPQVQVSSKPSTLPYHKYEVVGVGGEERFLLRNDDFPTLSALNSNKKQINVPKRSIRQ